MLSAAIWPFILGYTIAASFVVRVISYGNYNIYREGHGFYYEKLDSRKME